MYTFVNPRFTIDIKKGFNGVKIMYACFRDVNMLGVLDSSQELQKLSSL